MILDAPTYLVFCLGLLQSSWQTLPGASIILRPCGGTHDAPGATSSPASAAPGSARGGGVPPRRVTGQLLSLSKPRRRHGERREHCGKGGEVGSARCRGSRGIGDRYQPPPAAMARNPLGVWTATRCSACPSSNGRIHDYQ